MQIMFRGTLLEKEKAVIKFIPVDDDGNLLIDKLPELITDKTKIIAVTHMSNVTGTIVDIKKLKKLQINIIFQFVLMEHKVLLI